MGAGRKEEEVVHRIKKDIGLFDESVASLKGVTDKKVRELIDLSKIYASDSKSYLEKGDLFTSFYCIAYAHGILDAIKGLLGRGLSGE
jgi:hypothetical protein